MTFSGHDDSTINIVLGLLLLLLLKVRSKVTGLRGYIEIYCRIKLEDSNLLECTVSYWHTFI